jgi:hypothetical protein
MKGGVMSCKITCSSRLSTNTTDSPQSLIRLYESRKGSKQESRYSASLRNDSRQILKFGLYPQNLYF